MLWNKNWINEEKNSTDVNKVTFHWMNFILLHNYMLFFFVLLLKELPFFYDAILRVASPVPGAPYLYGVTLRVASPVPGAPYLYEVTLRVASPVPGAICCTSWRHGQGPVGGIGAVQGQWGEGCEDRSSHTRHLHTDGQAHLPAWTDWLAMFSLKMIIIMCNLSKLTLWQKMTAILQFFGSCQNLFGVPHAQTARESL